MLSPFSATSGTELFDVLWLLEMFQAFYMHGTQMNAQ
jgi:hypothetical protein